MTRLPARERITQLEQKNAELTSQLEAQKLSHEAQLQGKEQEHQTETDTLNTRIEELEERLDEKQDQLNDRELKKFAEAFGKQESQFQVSADTWFKYVLTAFAVTLLGTFALISWAHQSSVWYEKLAYYLVDVILLTSLVFSLKQYSYYIKLSTDYGNRKTLAQSYHNILTSVDDMQIKDKFLNESVNVLAARAEVKDEPNTIPEKLAESLADSLKTLANKV